LRTRSCCPKAQQKGLPVCMTAAQAKANTGVFRIKQCEEERAKAAVN
jgi:hypothetical protein